LSERRRIGRKVADVDAVAEQTVVLAIGVGLAQRRRLAKSCRGIARFPSGAVVGVHAVTGRGVARVIRAGHVVVTVHLRVRARTGNASVSRAAIGVRAVRVRLAHINASPAVGITHLAIGAVVGVAARAGGAAIVRAAHVVVAVDVRVHAARGWVARVGRAGVVVVAIDRRTGRAKPVVAAGIDRAGVAVVAVLGALTYVPANAVETFLPLGARDVSAVTNSVDARVRRAGIFVVAVCVGVTRPRRRNTAAE
jgi:hypothetical protein